MDPIEQRVRDSLRARADDVEPTPALYQGVQRRIARRRRVRLAALVPAGATALAVAVAVPLVLDTGPQVPSIDDYAEQQVASPAAPTRVVTVDRDGEVALLDLTDGSIERPYGQIAGQGLPPEIDVAPEDRADVPTVHTALVEDRTEGPVLSLGYLTAGSSGGGVEVGLDSYPQVAGRFAVSPDGGWTAVLTGPMEDADGWAVQLRPSDASGATAGATQEPGIVVPAGSVIQDWRDDTATEPGRTELTVVTPEGILVGFPLVRDGGAFSWPDETVAVLGDTVPVVAYASDHLGDDGGFALLADADRLVVQATVDAEVLGTVDVSGVVGDQDHDTLALDAWGHSAVLSSPGGAWLLATDGDGGFTDPVALPDGTVRAALVGREVTEQGARAAGDPEAALLGFEDGTLAVVDLVDGDREVVLDDGPVVQVVAAPGGGRDAFRAVAVTQPPGASAVVTTIVRDGGTSASDAVLATDLVGGTGAPPSVAVSTDGRWLAYTGASQQLEGAPAVHLVPIGPDGAIDVDRAIEVHTVTVADPLDLVDELVEWTGPVGAEGDVSHLRVRGERQGRLVLERTADGFVVQQRETDGGDLGDAIDVSTGFGAADDEVFTLRTGDDGLPEVRFGDVAGSAEALGGAPDEVRLDARGRTALLVGGGTAVTVRFAGEARVEVSAPTDGVVAGALLGGVPPDQDLPAAPVDDAVDERPAAPLPAPLVLADARSVFLRTDAGDTGLLDLAPEGESSVLEVAVRPGSTPDDLTVVVATLAEGFTDLRWVEVTDGQVQDPTVLEPPYASAGATDASVRVEGLAWTPDGQKLLWVERADAGQATLRSVGWDDGPGTGDTATDNASFGLPFAFGAGLVDVVDAGGGRVVARFASPDDNRGWYHWVLEIQGDGALAAPTAEPELVTSPVSPGGVTALAGADDEARPTWLLVFESGGPRLVTDPFGTPRDLEVPAEVAPGDGLPETWLHALGDGVLVGGSGRAWVLDADGQATALGDAVDADPVR